MSRVDAFLDEVPDYEIRDGIMYIAHPNWCMAMPLRIFKRGCAKATRVIAEYDAKKAEVVPLRRKKGDHAAS